jgi:hypothetical protein
LGFRGIFEGGFGCAGWDTSKQGKTPPNKGGDTKQGGGHQTSGKYFKQENPQQARNRLSSKGYLPIKCKSLQVVGVSSQGKAVVSDSGYGVIGG